jgi:hypothetical protein
MHATVGEHGNSMSCHSLEQQNVRTVCEKVRSAASG